MSGLANNRRRAAAVMPPPPPPAPARGRGAASNLRPAFPVAAPPAPAPAPAPAPTTTPISPTGAPLFTLPQVVAITDKRLIALETSVKELQDGGSSSANNEDIDELFERCDMLANELADLKDALMKLQLFSMELMRSQVSGKTDNASLKSAADEVSNIDLTSAEEEPAPAPAPAPEPEITISSRGRGRKN